MIGETSYYRGTIYMNWRPWENNREHTWSKYKGRVDQGTWATEE